jgi:hypothetical protein
VGSRSSTQTATAVWICISQTEPRVVTIVDDRGRTQSAVCTTASSYQSASDQRVHFGVGEATTVRRVEVRWPRGGVQTVNDIAADRMLEIVEPTGASPAR